MKILSVMIASMSLAVSAGTKTYYLIDDAGGDVTSSAIWRDGSVPPASSSSDTLNVWLTNVTVAASTRLQFPAETPYVWDTIGLGYKPFPWNSISVWQLAGGQLTLKTGLDFRARGTLKVASELTTTAADGLTVNGGTVQLLGPRAVASTYAAVNGNLTLGSDDAADNSTGDVLATGTAVRADGTGKILVRQDATAATLAGSNDMAVVDIPAGKTLTLAGLAGTINATTYAGDLTGSGTLVKGGANYTLTLSGASWTNRTFDGTVRVDAGVLELAGQESAPTAPNGILCYYTFDDPVTAGVNLGKQSSYETYNVIPVRSFSGTELTTSEVLYKDNLLADGGIRGRCVHYDGVRALVADTNGSVLPIKNKPFAVVLWFRNSKSNTSVLFRWGANAATSRIHAAVLKSGGIAFNRNLAGYDDGSKFLTGTSFNDNKWHMLVCMFDGVTTEGALNGYVSVDGCNFATDNIGGSSTATTSSRLLIGADWYNQSCPVATSSLSIDEFAVYNRLLTQDEVTALYAAKRSAIFTAAAEAELPETVAHWQFDDESNVGKDSGPHACDLIRGANAGKSYYPKTLPDSPFGGRYGCTAPNRTGTAISFLYGNANTETYLPKGDSSASVSFWYSIAETAYARNTNRRPDFWWGARSSCTFQQRGSTTGIGTIVGILGSSKIECQDVLSLPNENVDTGWHHITMTYDSSTKVAIWYVDARQILSETLSSGANFSGGTNFVFGAEPTYVGGSSQWNSYARCFDEIKVYDRALTADEIALDRRSTMPCGRSVVSTNVNLQVGAQGRVFLSGGAWQSFASFANAGALALGDGAKLVFDDGEAYDIGGSLVTGMRYADAGTIEVSGGSRVTLSGTCDFAPETELVVTNGSLTISGTANACQVRVQAGGAFASANGCADVVLEAGAVLSPTSPLVTSGTVTLPDTVTVDVRAWDGERTALVTAGTISGTLPVHVTYLQSAQGFSNIFLELKENKLWLRRRKGFVLIYR